MKTQQEIWKSIEGYPDYQVSNFGRVKSLERLVSKRNGFRLVKECILKPCISISGYYMVGLRADNIAKSKQVHQLVAMAFMNHKPCGMELVINHIDFNRHNNHVNNLEIVTSRENSNLKHIPSTSQYVGVCWYKKGNKWVSQITINGKKKHLGFFTDEKEASEAYQKALNN